MKSGEEIIALGILYLIKPSLVSDWNDQYINKIKSVASKIYEQYILNKNAMK
jgi:hypothetical protein